jgi:hypothetical protein
MPLKVRPCARRRHLKSGRGRGRPPRRPQLPQAGPDAATVSRTGGRGRMSGLIVYTAEDGSSRIQRRADGRPVSLTQAEMAELFYVTAENIRQHLKSVFADKELEPERTSRDSLVVQQEGGRAMRRHVTQCILDRPRRGPPRRSPRAAWDGKVTAGSQCYARLPCIWSRLALILLPAFNMGRGRRLMHASLA